MDHAARAVRKWRLGCNWLAMVCLTGATIFWLGCSSGTPSANEGQSSGGSATGADKPAQSSQTSNAAASKAEAVPSGQEKQVTAQGVLEGMVAVYQKAASYADGGQISLQGQVGDQRLDAKPEFLVAFVRPNKLLLRAYQGIVVCDGKHLSAFIKDLPSQVIQSPAPAQVTMESLYRDPILTSALTDMPPQAFAAFPTPLILLLAKDPLKTILYRAEKTELLPSDKIGNSVCYRVQIARPEGNTVYWIDQKDRLLRRVEYPTEALKQVMAGPVQSLSLVADYRAAQINVDVDPKAFQFEVPTHLKAREHFAPPDLDLLGKPVADFEFADADGKPITLKTLAGKTVVLEFWSTDCRACPLAFPELQELYRQYKGNEKVVFLAVSADDPKLDSKVIQQKLAEWKSDIPLARDLKNTRQALKVTALPTLILLGPNGALLQVQVGVAPGSSVDLSAKIRQSLAGEDVAALTLRRYEEGARQFAKIAEQWSKADLFVASPGVQLSIVIPPRSEPASLKMTRLWSCNKLAAPGNILAVEQAGGQPRILVLDAGNAVAEMTAAGNVRASTSLNLPPDRLLAAIRTGLTAEGKRVFVGFNSDLPQLYVLDDKLQRILAFPSDDENPRMNIADVELARLTADGPLVMLVGYWGIAGVQAVTLDGKRVWTNKTVDVVSRLAVLGPDAQGHRSLLCTNVGGDGRSMVRIDWQGQREAEIKVPSRRIAWIACADLTGKGSSEICALAPDDVGNVTVVGLTAAGKETWAYPLPESRYDTAVERAVVGNVFADGSAQWIIPAADGSIHFLTADGKLLDRFHYGDRICGLAMTKLDGHAVLLVATPQAVEAWKVEPLAKR